MEKADVTVVQRVSERMVVLNLKTIQMMFENVCWRNQIILLRVNEETRLK